MTGSQWQQLRKSPVVEDTFLEDDWNLTVTGSDLPEDVQGVYLSSNGFNFFGVPAALGRGLQPSDAIDGQDPQPVVVLGYKFWQRHFNADPAVLGKDDPAGPQELHHRRASPASRFTWGDGDVYLPLKMTADQVRDLLCRSSPETGREPRAGRRRAAAADLGNLPRKRRNTFRTDNLRASCRGAE